MKNSTPTTITQNVSCAVYARSATVTLWEDGITKQLAAIRKCANNFGWTITAEYTDSATSGLTIKRKGLMNIIEGVKTGKFMVILVDDLSRISRNLIDLHYFLQLMDTNEVRVFSVAEGTFIGTTTHSAFCGPQTHHFLKDLASRVRRGQQAAVKSGRGMGPPPFGYQLIRSNAHPTGHWQIDAEQAQIVRRIFCEYAAGTALRDIARQLNSENISYPRSPRGTWRPTHILSCSKTMGGILRNPIYRGEYVWGKSKYHRTPDGRRISGPTQENERVVRGCPQLKIVDDGLWNSVQQVIRDCCNADSKGGN